MNGQKYEYDVAILGGGPAGVSCALYACRAGRRVAIVHNGLSALHRARNIENYYGSGKLGGAELYERGLEQAKAVGAEIIKAQVTFAEFDGARFTLTASDTSIVSDKLVIATGASRVKTDIPGLDEIEKRGKASYCAVCDAFFYRKKSCAVIGAGDFAAHEYGVLSNVADAVLLTNGETPSVDVEKTDTRRILKVEFTNDGKVRVCFMDGELAVDGLFIALGVLGATAIAKSMGVITDKSGNIAVDENGMTNIPGLYAAGDCTAGIRQVAKAVADGMNVGMKLGKMVVE